MSKIHIHKYYQNIDRTVAFGKSRNEQSIRTSFLNLFRRTGSVPIPLNRLNLNIWLNILKSLMK